MKLPPEEFDPPQEPVPDLAERKSLAAGFFTAVVIVVGLFLMVRMIMWQFEG